MLQQLSKWNNLQLSKYIAKQTSDFSYDHLQCVGDGWDGEKYLVHTFYTYCSSPWITLLLNRNSASASFQGVPIKTHL